MLKDLLTLQHLEVDRLKIKLILTKKALTDKNDTDFIELMRIDEGKLK